MPGGERISWRSRMWPSRRYFEHRQERLEARVDDLQRDIFGLQQSLDRLAAVSEQMATAQERLVAGQSELRVRLRRTQGLAARVYEAGHDWPIRLEQARGSERYALAYEEAQPLISIPIPTYHSPDTLCERALASVRAQTYENWEAIVVGDHCTDDTGRRVRALGDERIRFHNLPVRENEPDDPWERWAVKGSVPRAVGIGMARGPWVAPLSHDDAWDPDHLETLLAAARDARAEVAYSRMRRMVEGGPPGTGGSACGAWPPRLGQFNWQASLVNGALDFLRYDRVCALASEPNDWNLARRAWEAGVRFHFVERETATLYLRPENEVLDALAERGLPPEATASP